MAKKFNVRGNDRALLSKLWNTTEQIRAMDARRKEHNLKHPDRKRPLFQDKAGTITEALDLLDERIAVMLDTPLEEEEE